MKVRNNGRVAVIDGLRGLASLAVCWYHFVYADHAFDGGGAGAAMLRASAMNAWIGVEVFFVISGFVIPLALWRSQYTLRGYGIFLLKRLTRLEPPYLVSAALCLVLWYLWATVPHLHGPPFTPSADGLLLHLAYLNAFFHRGWLNPVYWTLAIEFQYYLGMGLLFAAIANRRPAIRLLAFGVLAALTLLFPAPSLVFHYLFVFMLGIATFQYHVGLLRLPAYLPLLAILTAGCSLTLGPLIAAIALLTALVIAFVRRDLPVLGWLGTISYSLYLIHVPVGGRILSIGLAHVSGGLARLAVLILTLLLTIGAAWVLYLLVERPAQRWSSSIGAERRKGARIVDRGAERAPTVTGIAEP